MSYEISESNWMYDSCILEADKTVIIGIPRDFIIGSEEWQHEELPQIIDEVSLVSSNSCDAFHNIDNYANRLLKLSLENRIIIVKLIDQLKEDGTLKRHIGYNSAAILNFLSARYQENLSRIIITDPLPPSVFPESATIDAFQKLRNTAAPGKDKQRLINYQCSYYLITPSVLYSGVGKLYCVVKPNYLTDEQFTIFRNKYVSKLIKAVEKDDLGANFDIKQILMQDSIISESQIEEWTIKTFFTYWNAPGNIAKIINYLLDTMK